MGFQAREESDGGELLQLIVTVLLTFRVLGEKVAGLGDRALSSERVAFLAPLPSLFLLGVLVGEELVR